MTTADTSRPDPSAIMALATGYWNSAAMLAAIKLGIFDTVASGSQTSAAITKSIDGDLRAVTMLLDACAALRLLERNSSCEPATYTNSPSASAFLVSSSPGYMGSAIIWAADQYAAWGKLAETVLTGRPAVAPELHLGEDPVQTRTFVLGMHNRAIGMARGVVRFLDLEGCKSLLDVGGGPGTYSVLLAEKYPELRTTVFDLPGIVSVASELVSPSPAADRVMMRPGNAVTDEYGDAEFDAILFSGVLHQMSPDTIRNMLLKARKALQPGGTVIVCDVMLDSSRIHPEFATLFSIQMLLASNEGHVFAAEDVRLWLSEAGFDQIEEQALPPPLPYVTVTGRLA